MDDKFLDELKNKVQDILPTITEIRQQIHQHPEMALEEFNTSKTIRNYLSAENIRQLDPFLETDVVAFIDGNEKGKNVTLRADMDALPIQEKTKLPYASQIDGVMHACGHDGHTSMLLGAALILNQLKNQFKGSIRFVFQPGEEIVAAGKDLVLKGALKNPVPDAVFALHAGTNLPVGTIASKPGVFMAAADMFKIVIKGQGAHGSRPEQSVDPILTGAQLIQALQSLVSRSVSPLDSVVVSLCHIYGGSNANTIPDTVSIEGTIRYLKPSLKEKIHTYMEQVISGVCNSMGASYDYIYSSPYFATINHSSIVDLGKQITEEIFGAAKWQNIEHPAMGAEDFSYYIKHYPGAMFRIGMGEKCAPLHNAKFDFNDNALKNGIMFLVCSALKVLNP